AGVCVVLDGRNPSDRPTARPSDEILRLRVLEEGVLGGREQRAHVHSQLWDPEGVAAVMVVGKGDEALEIAPVGDGRDLHCAQMTPSSLPSRAKTSRAGSICWAASTPAVLAGGSAAVKIRGRELCFR